MVGMEVACVVATQVLQLLQLLQLVAAQRPGNSLLDPAVVPTASFSQVAQL